MSDPAETDVSLHELVSPDSFRAIAITGNDDTAFPEAMDRAWLLRVDRRMRLRVRSHLTVKSDRTARIVKLLDVRS